jgi:hypothetical protein
MQGPYLTGSHAEVATVSPGAWEENRIFRGRRYCVVKDFRDADGELHAVGEEWRFIASMFSPYDDELMLVICKDDDREWRIILRWTPDAQQQVIENFQHHVRPME